VSLFVSLFVSVFVSVLAGSPASLGAFPRESVLYQPEPLNTIAGVVISLRGRLPQFGHFSMGPSLNDWTAEKRWPHLSQR
jgi:hypothetical protein